MKKFKSILLLCCVYVLGCGSYKFIDSKIVNAQITPLQPQELICQTNSGDTFTATPCEQYIVQLITQRGFNGFQIFQVQPDSNGNGIPIFGHIQVSGGSVGASLRSFETSPKNTTVFDIVVSEEN